MGVTGGNIDNATEHEDAVDTALDELLAPDTDETDAEKVILVIRSKLCARGGSPRWTECGAGVARLLRHRESHRVRLFMRSDKTNTVIANHYAL